MAVESGEFLRKSVKMIKGHFFIGIFLGKN